MPQRKKIEPAQDATSAPVEETKPTPIRPVGHVPAARWVRTTARWQDDTDESLAFSCEINVAGLSMNNTTWVWDADATLGDLWEFFKDRVRNWNATAYDHASKSWIVAPGPEELGWKAFALVDAQYTTYVVLMLNDALRGGDARPKSVAS